MTKRLIRICDVCASTNVYVARFTRELRCRDCVPFLCTKCGDTQYVLNGKGKRRCRSCNTRKYERRFPATTLDRGDKFFEIVERDKTDHSKCKPWTDVCCGECLRIYADVCEQREGARA